jgi:hypothetical protein
VKSASLIAEPIRWLLSLPVFQLSVRNLQTAGVSNSLRSNNSIRLTSRHKGIASERAARDRGDYLRRT